MITCLLKIIVFEFRFYITTYFISLFTVISPFCFRLYEKLAANYYLHL